MKFITGIYAQRLEMIKLKWEYEILAYGNPLGHWRYTCKHCQSLIRVLRVKYCCLRKLFWCSKCNILYLNLSLEYWYSMTPSSFHPFPSVLCEYVALTHIQAVFYPGLTKANFLSENKLEIHEIIIDTSETTTMKWDLHRWDSSCILPDNNQIFSQQISLYALQARNGFWMTS